MTSCIYSTITAWELKTAFSHRLRGLSWFKLILLGNVPDTLQLHVGSPHINDMCELAMSFFRPKQ